MSSGFFALLDDIAAIAKVAAASLDDAALQAMKAGQKAAGIVIDDAAVTPRYVVGVAAARELPIIGRIALGSLRNKFLFLLPAALLLSAFAPWAITPLLMAGGAFLCFEGYEKVLGLLHPPALAKPKPGEAVRQSSPQEEREREDATVAAAIRTDFILSAEIMAISLAAVTTPSFWGKAFVLAVIALSITVLVYGAVALIVKADDVGLHLAQKGPTAVIRAIGRGIVTGMPAFLKALSLVGTVAMLWVGGGIILHGFSDYGLGAIPYAIHAVAAGIGGVFGPLSGFVTWLIDATVAAIFGLGIGWMVVAAMSRLGFSPAH
jgi:predicted DNA repair protein MutK